MRDLLLILNEWWEREAISRDKAREYRRKIFPIILDTFNRYRQIIILTGLRRVGKTTLMFQIIENLLKQGVNARKIFYYSFDEMVEDPIKVLNEYSKITKVDWRRENVFLFLDEVHKLRNWSSKVKLLYDNLPNLRICISGSASLLVEEEAFRNLAGRYFLFEIPPLTLQEYGELYFGRKIDSYEIYCSKLETILDDYIRKPFPEIVKWTDIARVNEYIRTLIIEKIVRTDIPQAFQGVNISLLSTLTEIFMRDVGAILNLTSLARDLRVHKLTLRKHLKLLEYGKIFRIVKNYRPSIRAETRKLPKIYPFHIALAYCFYPELTKGQIYETLVATALNLHKYWRQGNREIDFLKINREITPIEVKAREKISDREIKNLLKFMEKNRLKKGIVIYAGKELEEKTINQKIILLYPLTKLLYNFKLETYRKDKAS